MTPKYRIATFALFLIAFAGFPMRGAACPTQSAQAMSPVCGIEYGATIQFTYTGAANWWFKERVVSGVPNECQAGDIDQTTTPFQSSTGIIYDEVVNTNGPPATVAPCQDLTHQTIYTGPTQPAVNQCQFPNGQIIQVTSTPKRVRTSSGGSAIDCTY